MIEYALAHPYLVFWLTMTLGIAALLCLDSIVTTVMVTVNNAFRTILIVAKRMFPDAPGTYDLHPSPKENDNESSSSQH